MSPEERETAIDKAKSQKQKSAKLEGYVDDDKSTATSKWTVVQFEKNHPAEWAEYRKGVESRKAERILKKVCDNSIVLVLAFTFVLTAPMLYSIYIYYTFSGDRNEHERKEYEIHSSCMGRGTAFPVGKRHTQHTGRR